jgi:hypothetical protein
MAPHVRANGTVTPFDSSDETTGFSNWQAVKKVPDTEQLSVGGQLG